MFRYKLESVLIRSERGKRILRYTMPIDMPHGGVFSVEGFVVEHPPLFEDMDSRELVNLFQVTAPVIMSGLVVYVFWSVMPNLCDGISAHLLYDFHVTTVGLDQCFELL